MKFVSSLNVFQYRNIGKFNRSSTDLVKIVMFWWWILNMGRKNPHSMMT